MTNDLDVPLCRRGHARRRLTGDDFREHRSAKVTITSSEGGL